MQVENIPETIEPSIHRLSVPDPNGGERILAVAAMGVETVEELASEVGGTILGIDETFEMESVEGVLPKDLAHLIERFAAPGVVPGI